MTVGNEVGAGLGRNVGSVEGERVEMEKVILFKSTTAFTEDAILAAKWSPEMASTNKLANSEEVLTGVFERLAWTTSDTDQTEVSSRVPDVNRRLEDEVISHAENFDSVHPPSTNESFNEDLTERSSLPLGALPTIRSNPIFTVDMSQVVGANVGTCVGTVVGDGVGVKVGDGTGTELGAIVGIEVGEAEGVLVGYGVGRNVGRAVGCGDGTREGLGVGS